MVNLNGIKVKNRVWLAAGAGGYGEGWPHQKLFIKLGLIDLSAFGAVITRTLTPELRHGNYINPLEFENATFMSQMSQLCHIFSKERKRVLRKVRGGWINNMGWWNVGIDYFIEKIYPRLKNVAIIPNIGGFIVEHYTNSIQKLNPLKIAAIEINISCPNVEYSLADNPSELVKLFTFCRESSAHPLIIKLGVENYLQIARIAEYCGFNAVSAINSVKAFEGGYSGPAIKPIALKVVSDLKKEVGLPIIGGGGIASRKDCDEFFESAGVDAVALGSGFILKPWEPNRIVKKYKKDPASK